MPAILIADKDQASAMAQAAVALNGRTIVESKGWAVSEFEYWRGSPDIATVGGAIESFAVSNTTDPQMYVIFAIYN